MAVGDPKIPVNVKEARFHLTVLADKSILHAFTGGFSCGLLRGADISLGDASSKEAKRPR